MSRVLARPLDTRTIALSVAGLLAVGTGVMTYNYLASVGHANAPASQRTILVAAKRIPAKATITAEMLSRVSRQADSVDPDALVVPASAIGSTAVNEIPAGSQLTSSKLVHYVAAGLPGRVHVGMRAVSIALDKVKGVSNLIQAGDKVDVIAATAPRNDAAPRAVTIIRGATVLSIGTITEAGATPAPEAQQQFQTATLEVTPKQADLITLADVNTTLRLTLRSPRESLRSQPTEKLVLTAPSQTRPMGFAPPMPQAAPQQSGGIRPAAPAAPQVRNLAPSVAVIDGDKVVSSGTQR
jgi:pilus assembly protein CpaB